MAQIVSNEKGFKVIHVETLDMWAIGSPTKCDYCTADMATPDGGYYIAVLKRYTARNVINAGFPRLAATRRTPLLKTATTTRIVKSFISNNYGTE
ncbi:hypothetical protein [Hominenteromicrobium sp.]|jgi:hypothetical protein|uniref:hypothetical protein n=1 Tax=Hominenteromicrobium sp. TaxID=3073581 RepID=UPI002658F6BE|nr:hypothetical protein [Alistipes shahii]